MRHHGTQGPTEERRKALHDGTQQQDQRESQGRAWQSGRERPEQDRCRGQAEDDPDEEAAEGQHGDEEPLPIARPGEERQQHQDQQVEAGHAALPVGLVDDRRIAAYVLRHLGHPGRVPGTIPARNGEQPVEDPGGEAPHRHARNLERRADEPAGIAHAQPVGRVDELGDRHPVHSGDLGRVTGPDRGRLAPPAEDGRHLERRHGQRQRRQDSEDVDAGRIEAGLLVRLAQRRAHRPIVVRVDRSARERRLPGVGAQLRGALDEEHVARGSRRVASAGPNSTSTAAARVGPWGIAGTRKRTSSATSSPLAAADSCSSHAGSAAADVTSRP